MAGQRFSVFGHVYLIARERGQWRVWSVGNDGKRMPENVVIPDFVEDAELEEFLFDLFHESAAPGKGDVRRIS